MVEGSIVMSKRKKIKNPLNKRYIKELKHDIGKYIVIFLFMTLTIAFISGFLVTDNSMKIAYDESFEKYNVEDGHFECKEEMTLESIKELEDSSNIKIYKSYYVEKEVLSNEILRIFVNRTEINKASIHKGNLPQECNEIALDRLYAVNNSLDVGDSIEIDGKSYMITGLVALSDYSALFKSNTDFMFDANAFGVAVTSESGMNNLTDSHIHYQYSWLNNDKYESDDSLKEHSDDIKLQLIQSTNVSSFISRADNQSINFTGDDMGSDKAMMTTLLYIVIVIMAFVFAITISNTIESESTVIGTLRASGYTKSELLRHYLMLPVLITIISAFVGNILGYSVFKYITSSMYYNSYSLPVYKTIWNADAFILTTIIPSCIMTIINIIVLVKRLSLSPIKFLKRDFSKKAKKKVVKLPEIKFLHRFQIRVILQNKINYLILFVGILFANVLLLFGMMMSPLLKHYNNDIRDNMVCKYQYILKTPVETKISGAEKYVVTTVKSYLAKADKDDDISVYGIEDNSSYFTEIDKSLLDSDKDSDESIVNVYASDGYLEKHSLKIGDIVTIKDSFDDTKEYKVKIVKAIHYPATLALFMNIDELNSMFNMDKEYFSGYFTNEKLTDIADENIATCIKEKDLTNMVEQLQNSLGDMFILVCGFAVILYLLLIYLLSKIIIEKNEASISMIKILGYNNKEVGALYLISTGIALALSVGISIPLSFLIIKSIYFQMMSSFAGWLPMYISTSTYIEMAVIGMISFVIIALLQLKRISKIPMEEALKNAE